MHYEMSAYDTKQIVSAVLRRRVPYARPILGKPCSKGDSDEVRPKCILVPLSPSYPATISICPSASTGVLVLNVLKVQFRTSSRTTECCRTDSGSFTWRRQSRGGSSQAEIRSDFISTWRMWRPGRRNSGMKSLETGRRKSHGVHMSLPCPTPTRRWFASAGRSGSAKVKVNEAKMSFLLHRACLLLEVKRTWLSHRKMCASDPKQTRAALNARIVPRLTGSPPRS